MKISIVTVCYNSALTIKDTINSVLGQTYQNIEYIVIDGGSQDNTLDILSSYAGKLTYVSETDDGIYDAMNKGIALATGDVVGTLNADDFYANNHVLEDVISIFRDQSIEACFGDLEYVSQKNTDLIVRYWKSQEYTSGLFESGWMPAHPTFFARRNVYDRHGKFNLNYKIAADFELLFRIIEQSKVKTKYLPKVLVKMRLGGTTNKSISNIINQNKEIIAVLKKEYPKFSFVKFILNKFFNRLFQFLRRS